MIPASSPPVVDLIHFQPMHYMVPVPLNSDDPRPCICGNWLFYSATCNGLYQNTPNEVRTDQDAAWHHYDLLPKKVFAHLGRASFGKCRLPCETFSLYMEICASDEKKENAILSAACWTVVESSKEKTVNP